MATIGDFPMPEDFRYKDVYLKPTLKRVNMVLRSTW